MGERCCSLFFLLSPFFLLPLRLSSLRAPFPPRSLPRRFSALRLLFTSGGRTFPPLTDRSPKKKEIPSNAPPPSQSICTPTNSSLFFRNSSSPSFASSSSSSYVHGEANAAAARCSVLSPHSQPLESPFGTTVEGSRANSSGNTKTTHARDAQHPRRVRVWTRRQDKRRRLFGLS